MRVWVHSIFTRFVPGAESEVTLDAEEMPLREVLAEASRGEPLIILAMTDETGAIRQHVNVFVNGRRCRDLSVIIRRGDEVAVFPAVSGG